MFLQDDYVVAWLSYLGGFLLLFAVLWYLTRNLPWASLRYGLRLMLAVLLLTPWYSAPQSEYMSPAWLMAIFEGIFESNYQRAGAPLAAALSVSMAVFAVGCGVYWYFFGSASKNKAKPAAGRPQKTQRKTPTIGTTAPEI